MEAYKIVLGGIVLALGFLAGVALASVTKDELKEGKKWFGVLAIAGILGAAAALFLRNYILLFSFLLITSVAGGSLAYSGKP